MENTVTQEQKCPSSLRWPTRSPRSTREAGERYPGASEGSGTHQYLPPEVMKRIGERLGVPPAQIFGVASFYAQFRLAPVGQYVVKICHGTACITFRAQAPSRTRSATNSA